LTVKPRTTSSGGNGGGNSSKQPIRRTRSRSTSKNSKNHKPANTRMSLNSSIATSSARRTRKNYTQTIVEQRQQRSKSRQQKQQQQQQKPQKQSLVRTRSFSKPHRSHSRLSKKKSTPLTLSYTSALLDPTLARNKKSNNKTSPEDDDRDANPQCREDATETRHDDDDPPPKMVTILPPKKKSFIDTFGDVVVDANDALVAIVCDNEGVIKTIFPYDVDGTPIETTSNNIDDIVVGKEDKREEQDSVEDFYTGVNQTLSEEGFEATPSALYAVEKGNNDGGGAAVAVAGAAAVGAAGVFSIGKLGKLMKRQIKGGKKKKGGKSTSDGKGEGEAEPTDEPYFGEGQEVQRGQAIDNDKAEAQGLAQEVDVLLSIYDPELDSSKRKKHGEQLVEEDEEGTIVEGQDLELEMMGDRNVLALGFGAFAVCSGDDNTIVTTDQRELTLQDYSSNHQVQQQQMMHEPILENESNDVIILDSNDAKKTRRERELRQEKRVLLGRMKARNIRAAKKALAVQESMSRQSSQPKSVVANDKEELSAEEAIVEDENANQNVKDETTTDESATVPDQNTIVEDDNTVTAENWECTLDDYKRPKLISRISSLKSKSEKTSEDALKKDVNESSNNRSEVKCVKETSEPQVESVKETSELLDEIEQLEDLEEIPVQALLAAFSDDSVVLKSFEVDDGISMHSSISMATGLRKDSAEVDSKCSGEVDSRYTEYVSSDEESEASSKDDSRKASSWWNIWS